MVSISELYWADENQQAAAYAHAQSAQRPLARNAVASYEGNRGAALISQPRTTATTVAKVLVPDDSVMYCAEFLLIASKIGQGLRGAGIPVLSAPDAGRPLKLV